MIKIDFHKKFQKNYLKRIKNNKKLDFLFHKRVEQFILNPEYCQLNNHKLTGKLQKSCSFSINGDIRIIYQWIDSETVLFLDIGSHNQVY